MASADVPQEPHHSTSSALTPPRSYLYSMARHIKNLIGLTEIHESYKDRTALITGASSGIGAAFAEALAARSARLVLVAHPQDKKNLDDVVEHLKQDFEVEIDHFVADLSQPEGTQRIIDHLGDCKIDVLINNAGFATYGRFEETPIATVIALIECHVMSAVRLTHALLPQMLARGSGDIIHTAALGAFLPMPYSATYCASKAFLVQFSEALWAENKDKGLRILALCPGPTRTNIAKGFRLEPLGTMENAKDVVDTAMIALVQGQSRVHTTTLGAVKVILASLLPRRIVLNLSLNTMKQCALKSK